MSKLCHVNDVFSSVPSRGNPVAVVLGSDEPDGMMQGGFSLGIRRYAIDHCDPWRHGASKAPQDRCT